MFKLFHSIDIHEDRRDPQILTHRGAPEPGEQNLDLIRGRRASHRAEETSLYLYVEGFLGPLICPLKDSIVLELALILSQGRTFVQVT